MTPKTRPRTPTKKHVPVRTPRRPKPKVAAGPSPVPAVVAAREAPTVTARTTLFEALLKDLGQPGTLLEHPHGQSFSLRHELGDGALHTNRTLTLRMPRGGSTSHRAAFAVEGEGGPRVYLDIVDSQARLDDVKAGSFDALHLKKRHPDAFAILVFVRLPGAGLDQEVVESVAYNYDRVFGVDADAVAIGSKFAALRSEISGRLTHRAVA